MTLYSNNDSGCTSRKDRVEQALVIVLTALAIVGILLLTDSFRTNAQTRQQSLCVPEKNLIEIAINKTEYVFEVKAGIVSQYSSIERVELICLMISAFGLGFIFYAVMLDYYYISASREVSANPNSASMPLVSDGRQKTLPTYSKILEHV